MSHAEFHNARIVYAVANTPLYLLERLREDAEVQAFARRSDGPTLFGLMSSALETPPCTLQQAVLPYVYLICLALKNDILQLQRARALSSDGYKWFSYLVDIVNSTSTPTATVNLRSSSGNLSLSSRSGTKIQTVTLRNQ